LLLPLSMIPAQDQEAEGDEKIEDTIKRIQEEAEEEEEGEAEGGVEDEGDSCAGCQIFGEIFGEILGELFWQYMFSVRFAPYPYAEQSLFRYSTLVFEPGEPGRLYLDLYSLYAFLNDTIRFVHLAASLNYTLWRFSIGGGYNYNNIVGFVYAGPCLKISFWL